MKPRLFGRQPDRRGDIIPERESEVSRRRQILARVMGSSLEANLITCQREGLSVALETGQSFMAVLVDTTNKTGPHSGLGTTPSAALERAVREWAESK